MLSLLSQLRELNSTVQEFNETYRDLTETREERDARLVDAKPVRWFLCIAAVVGFFIILSTTLQSFDAETERHQKETVEAVAKLDCKANPWAIGCP